MAMDMASFTITANDGPSIDWSIMRCTTATRVRPSCAIRATIRLASTQDIYSVALRRITCNSASTGGAAVRRVQDDVKVAQEKRTLAPSSHGRALRKRNSYTRKASAVLL